MSKSKYKLSTGLATIIEQPFFKTDQEAWEYLRKGFSTPRYATLYKEVLVNVPIVNRKVYVKKHNAKYKNQKIKKVNMYSYWIPVLCGITSHKYRAVEFVS